MKTELRNKIYCDHCGDLEPEPNTFDCITVMPVSFDSGNKGESAVLCTECVDEVGIEQDPRTDNWQITDPLGWVWETEEEANLHMVAR